MNMFLSTGHKTPEEYIQSLTEPRKGEIISLHNFIQKVLPQFKPYIQSGMIGYGVFHYKYSSGKEGDWPVIALSSRKNYISVYVCVTKNGKYLPELYKSKFPMASIGKSCIRVKKLDDLNLSELENIIIEAVKQIE